MLSGWLIAAAVLLALAWGLKVTDYYSRLWVGTFFIGTAGGLAIGRFVMAGVVNGMAARGRVAQRVAVLGTGEGARQVVSSLRRERDFRYRIVGVFDDGHGDGAVPLEVERAPVLGDLDTLVSMIRNEGVDEVLIAMPAAEEERLVAILDRLSSLSVHVRLAPDPIVFRFAKRPITTLLGVPLIHVFERPISGWSSFLKMAEDRILSGLAVLFLAPLMLTIALLIKLDSPGPVLFAQQRRGLNSRLFRVYKFRTMYHDMADAECRQQTLRDDPRVTRIGRFLRATSLDELPQLFNVLKGDMSLVGPRPHAVATKAAGHLFEDVVREYAARYRVKPGITGWAQVNGWRKGGRPSERARKREAGPRFDIYDMSGEKRRQRPRSLDPIRTASCVTCDRVGGLVYRAYERLARPPPAPGCDRGSRPQKLARPRAGLSPQRSSSSRWPLCYANTIRPVTNDDQPCRRRDKS